MAGEICMFIMPGSTALKKAIFSRLAFTRRPCTALFTVWMCSLESPYTAVFSSSGKIHVATLLVAVYCLFREILKSRYTVYLILAAFLTIDVVCIDEIYGMARLQYTIPQEFGLYTLFLCTLYLIRFLKRETKGFDGNLFLFMTSLAASLAIHFYVTIMAFFLCASFAVFGLNQIFRKKNFGVLVTAVILGVVISTLPMVLAFASGIPLQGSLNWGMNIINGTDTKEGRSQAVQTSTGESTEAMTGITAEKSSENASSLPSQSQLDSQQGTVIEMESSTNVPKTPLVKKGSRCGDPQPETGLPVRLSAALRKIPGWLAAPFYHNCGNPHPRKCGDFHCAPEKKYPLACMLE